MLFWKKIKVPLIWKKGTLMGAIGGATLILLNLLSPLNLTASFAHALPPWGIGITEQVALGQNQSQLLQQGAQGGAVEDLQQQLQHLGYATSFEAAQFDGATARAVKSFQQRVGIAVDGIVGPETQQFLKAATIHAAAQLQSAPSQQFGVRPKLPPDMQNILERKKLIVALPVKDNPPFFMEDSTGKLWGSDVKIAQDLAQELGVELEFNRQAKTFNEVVDKVYNHEADLAISKISRTLKRAQRVRFSQPYLNMRQGLLINRIQLAEKSRGQNITETLRQLDGKIGVIKGSSYVGFVGKKFPKATVVELATWTDVVEAVKTGQVLAAYRDELEVKKIVLHEPNSSLQFQTVALSDTSDPIAMVIPWDSSQLLAFVDQYLDTANLDYTADHLLEEYAEAL